MSFHYYDCKHHGRKVRVVLGYDRPQREIFMRIHRLNDRGHSRSFLYTSVGDFANDGDLPYYKRKLEQLGIRVPDRLLEAVWEDAINGRGNYIVEHFADNTERVIYDDLVVTTEPAQRTGGCGCKE